MSPAQTLLEDVSQALATAEAHLRAGRFDQAEALYRAVATAEPQRALAHFRLASLLQRQDRPQEAMASYRAGLTAAPGNPQALTNLGGLLLQSGAYDEAYRFLTEAAAGKPDLAAAQANLAEACRALGRHGEAETAYRKALILQAQAPALHFGLTASLSALGRLDEAIESCRQGLALQPDNGTAQRILAELLRRAGRDDEALAALRQAAAGAGEVAELAAIARLAQELGDLPTALDTFGRLVQAAPQVTGHWQGLAEVLRLLHFQAFDPAAEALLAACLARDDLDHQDLAGATMSLLRAKPQLRPFLDAAAQQVAGDAGAGWPPELLSALQDPLLLRLLARTIAADGNYERALVRLRGRLIALCLDPDCPSETLEAVLPFAFALAQQCFLSEYVFTDSGPSQDGLADLRDLATGDGPWDARRQLAWAILAAFAPLGSFDGIAALTGEAAEQAPQLAAVIRQQIDEPAQEDRIKASIPSLTPIENEVAKEVRQFYEETPYPRWVSLKRIEGRPFAAFLRWLFPALPPDGLQLPESPRILIAGCGTGRHALLTTQFFQYAQVLAVDLSRASLAYAIRQARAHGIDNIDFAQADLHLLDDTVGSFDLIESSGVLVCVEDPLEGWRALYRRLRPGGFMKLALYSETARRHVVAARAYIAERGYGTDAESIRQCRQEIMASEDPLLRSVARGRDFFSTSMVRDLIFHIKEHRFTIPWIAEGIKTLGLEFLGFEVSDPVIRQRYRERFPDDPNFASFKNWQRYEAEFPETFAEMYQFWMRRPAD